MLNRILQCFAVLDSSIVFLTCIIPILLVLLTAAHHYLKEKKLIWRIAAFIPAVVFGIFYVFEYTAGNAGIGAMRYMPFAVAVILTALWGIIGSIDRIYVPSTIVSHTLSVICVAVGVIMAMTSFGHFKNFSHLGWADSLDALITDMEHNYVLRNHKKIDFDALRAEYVPLAEKAEEEKDRAEYYHVVREYLAEFRDGHVYATDRGNARSYEMFERYSGNDYGLSMIRLDSGDTVAVNVSKDSEAFACGIHDGTVITAWDGLSIEDACKDISYLNEDVNISSNENRDRFKEIFLAGKGGDTVEVTFIGDNGKLQTKTLEKTGSYRSRLNMTLAPFIKKPAAGNFQFKMLDEHCGYLSVTNESIYDTMEIIKTYLPDESPATSAKLEEGLSRLEEQGMDRMIIDIRGNDGGYEQISRAIISMFADEPFKLGSAYYNGEKNRFFKLNVTQPDGRWNDIPVVVLINMDCASSGDILAYGLSKCPNTTLMGFSGTWNCAQGIAARCYLTDCNIAITYPNYPTLDENGDFLIDADENGRASILPDVYIPLTEETLPKIFGGNESDFEIDHALEYINNLK